MHRKSIRLVAFLALSVVAALPATLFAQATGAWPRTITDDMGTSIMIARKPRTIVSVTLPTDEILLSLVGKDRIAAVTAFSEDPALSNVARQVADIPVKLTQLNAEVIISLRPDIVFVADWSDAAGVGQLRSAGICVYQFKSPVTVKQIQARIAAIGIAVGEEAAATKLSQWMDTRLAAVASKLARLAADKRLSIMDYNTWGTSMGPGSSWYEIVRLAGLTSTVASFPTDQYGSVPISKEMLLRLDPDILILPGWVSGDAKGSDAFYEGIMKDPALKGMKAIKTGRVHRMSEALKGATSQYIVLGVEDLAKYAYPTLFE